MNADKQINFIGIGAAKSGSSWLNNVLLQHPEIEIPPRKELTYFNRNNIEGGINSSFDNELDYYLRFWNFTDKEKIRGEYSPQYLNDLEAPSKIHKAFPSVKLIVILRNPVYRLLSHFEYDQHFNGIISKHLQVNEAIEKHPYLLNSGLYAKHLNRWFSIFRKDQIKVIIFEEAINNPLQTSENLFHFIGLDCPKKIDFSVVNERKEIKSSTFYQLLKVPGKIDKKLEKIESWKKVKQSSFYNSLIDAKTYLVDKNARKREKTEFSGAVYDMLNQHYKKPNEELAKLLDIKLDHWSY